MTTTPPPSKKKKLRLGICGCAAIAKKNAVAIERSSNCELVAVASRSIEKARAFCEELGFLEEVKQVEGYDELLRMDIDGVYLPLPSALHFEWVLKFAKAKKHIIVEKPVGLTIEQVREMIRACRENGVALMDGTMFMHHPRFLAMARLFDDKLHWHPMRVTAAFTFYGGPAFLDQGNIRTRVDGDPLGCLGDVGWYCVRIGLCAFRGERPLHVVARLHDSSETGNIPFDLDCDVYYKDGRLLTFHCSFKHHFRQWFEAVSVDPRYGSRIIRCDDFVIPRREELCDFDIEEIPNVQTIQYDTICASSKSTVPFYGASQERNMFDTFANDLVFSSSQRKYFERMTLHTHDIIHAITLSLQQNGQRIPVPWSSDDDLSSP